ncbi:MAG: hypothetical protein MZV64_17835 [Ignavibacteriales bacterium]|nr:hypothetical protein [Ignavibacteriales bacterium]
MAMHPDERPNTVTEFKEALLGQRGTPTLPISSPRLNVQPFSLMDYLASPRKPRWHGARQYCSCSACLRL